MKLSWTPEAIADRDAIFDYIEADNPAAAAALDELFSEKAERLTDHPKLGRPGRVEGTRELVVHENYILVYDIVGDLTRILRVLHAANRDLTSRRHAGLILQIHIGDDPRRVRRPGQDFEGHRVWSKQHIAGASHLFDTEPAVSLE